MTHPEPTPPGYTPNVIDRLNFADKELTNLDEADGFPDSEAFGSAVDAARSAINAARAIALAEN